MLSSTGQSSTDTKVLVRLNILVDRMSSIPSISLETRATDWQDILTDHQSVQLVKPFADGFQGLPSMALMKLGSSFPPNAETRPLSWMKLWISSRVFGRRDGFSRCSSSRIFCAFSIRCLGF